MIICANVPNHDQRGNFPVQPLFRGGDSKSDIRDEGMVCRSRAVYLQSIYSIYVRWLLSWSTHGAPPEPKA